MTDGDVERAHARLDAQLELLKKQKLILQTERELLKERNRLKREYTKALYDEDEPPTSRRRSHSRDSWRSQDTKSRERQLKSPCTTPGSPRKARLVELRPRSRSKDSMLQESIEAIRKVEDSLSKNALRKHKKVERQSRSRRRHYREIKSCSRHSRSRSRYRHRSRDRTPRRARSRDRTPRRVSSRDRTQRRARSRDRTPRRARSRDGTPRSPDRRSRSDSRARQPRRRRRSHTRSPSYEPLHEPYTRQLAIMPSCPQPTSVDRNFTVDPVVNHFKDIYSNDIEQQSSCDVANYKTSAKETASKNTNTEINTENPDVIPKKETDEDRHNTQNVVNEDLNSNSSIPNDVIDIVDLTEELNNPDAVGAIKGMKHKSEQIVYTDISKSNKTVANEETPQTHDLVEKKARESISISTYNTNIIDLNSTNTDIIKCNVLDKSMPNIAIVANYSQSSPEQDISLVKKALDDTDSCTGDSNLRKGAHFKDVKQKSKRKKYTDKSKAKKMVANEETPQTHDVVEKKAKESFSISSDNNTKIIDLNSTNTNIINCNVLDKSMPNIAIVSNYSRSSPEQDILLVKKALDDTVSCRFRKGTHFKEVKHKSKRKKCTDIPNSMRIIANEDTPPTHDLVKNIATKNITISTDNTNIIDLNTKDNDIINPNVIDKSMSDIAVVSNNSQSFSEQDMMIVKKVFDDIARRTASDFGEDIDDIDPRVGGVTGNSVSEVIEIIDTSAPPPACPKFVLIVKQLMKEMKSSIKKAEHVTMFLQWKLKFALRTLLREIVTGKDRMKKAEILKCFRERYPKDQDDEFVKRLAQEIDEGKYGDLGQRKNKKTDSRMDDDLIIIENHYDTITVPDSDDERETFEKVIEALKQMHGENDTVTATLQATKQMGLGIETQTASSEWGAWATARGVTRFTPRVLTLKKDPKILSPTVRVQRAMFFPCHKRQSTEEDIIFRTSQSTYEALASKSCTQNNHRETKIGKGRREKEGRDIREKSDPVQVSDINTTTTKSTEPRSGINNKQTAVDSINLNKPVNSKQPKSAATSTATVTSKSNSNYSNFDSHSKELKGKHDNIEQEKIITTDIVKPKVNLDVGDDNSKERIDVGKQNNDINIESNVIVPEFTDVEVENMLKGIGNVDRNTENTEENETPQVTAITIMTSYSELCLLKSGGTVSKECKIKLECDALTEGEDNAQERTNNDVNCNPKERRALHVASEEDPVLAEINLPIHADYDEESMESILKYVESLCMCNN